MSACPSFPDRCCRGGPKCSKQLDSWLRLYFTLVLIEVSNHQTDCSERVIRCLGNRDLCFADGKRFTKHILERGILCKLEVSAGGDDRNRTDESCEC